MVKSQSLRPKNFVIKGFSEKSPSLGSSSLSDSSELVQAKEDRCHCKNSFQDLLRVHGGSYVFKNSLLGWLLTLLYLVFYIKMIGTNKITSF